MTSTIILSAQRSGTTFLDLKLNGMYGLASQGGEITSPEFYHRHNVTELVRCDEMYNKNIHLKPGFHKTDHFDNNCYVQVDKHFIDTIVNKSNYASFNIMLNAIKFDIDLIKQINTPILYLIRNNLWERSVSHSMFANNGASKHLHLTRTTGEVTRPAVDGHHGDRSTGLQNVEVMA